MEPMRKPPGLQRRRHTWHLRVTVPETLRSVIGKREIIRSLRTHDYRQACERVSLARAEVDAMFAEARRKLRSQPATRLDAHEAKAAVLRWFWESERVGDSELPPDDIDDAEQEIGIDVATLSKPDNPNTVASTQQEAKRIMAENNLALDDTSKDYRRLCEFVRRAMLEQSHRTMARLRSDYSAQYDPLFNGVGPQVPEPPKPEPEGVTLGELCDLYLADPARARVTAKTRLDYNFTFRLIKEVMGAEKLVRSIERKNCRAVQDVLAALPPNATKRWPGSPLSQIAAMAKEQGIAAMAPRTANAYLHKLSALMRWAVREEYIDKNRAEELSVDEPEVHPRDARRPFSTDQLRRMFGAPLYRGCVDDEHGYARPGPNVIRRWRFWLLPIGLFSGMRLNEICSLRVDDVERRDDVWCFVVRPDNDGGKQNGRLKTIAAARVVPVHPMLIKMGLIKYADGVRDRGEWYLFPELEPDRRGYRADRAQKWFSRFMEKAGAREPRTSFHSTRHNFRDQLREVGATRDVTFALCGWSTGHVSDTYGGGVRPGTLAECVQKISYDVDHMMSG